MWKICQIVAKLNEEDENYHAALLLYSVGEPAFKLVVFGGRDQTSVERSLNILESYCVGAKN